MALVVALLVAAAATGHSAAAESDGEAAFVDAINELRAELGLAFLEPHAELTDLARAHAAEMAAAGEIFHADPISAGLEAGWLRLGENVGVGAGIDVLVDAFVASPGHYANIVDPSFTHIGVGVVWDGNALYTTHRFLQPPSAETVVSPPTGDPTPVESDPATAPVDGPVSPERVLALLALLDPVG